MISAYTSPTCTFQLPCCAVLPKNKSARQSSGKTKTCFPLSIQLRAAGGRFYPDSILNQILSLPGLNPHLGIQAQPWSATLFLPLHTLPTLPLFLFLEHTNLFLTSKPLHLPFPLPGTLSSRSSHGWPLIHGLSLDVLFQASLP